MPETELEPDYYVLIGVAPEATPEEVRRTYGERMRGAMDDRPRFEALAAAFEVLKDPAKRAAYDRRRRMNGVATPPPPPPSPTPSAPPTRGEPTRMGNSSDMNANPTLAGSTMMGGATAVMSNTMMGNATMGMGGDPLRTQALSLPPCPVCSTPGAPGEEFCLECGFLIGSALGAKPNIQALPKLTEQTTGREHLLKAGDNTVGREGADVMLPDKTVSRRHARILVDAQSGSVYMEDLGSTNGTRHDGKPLPAGQRTPLYDGGAIQFGSIKLKLSLPDGFAAALLALPAPAPTQAEDEPVAALAAPKGQEDNAARLIGKDGQTHILSAVRTTFGRRPGNTIIIEGDSFMSGNHAEILYENERFYLTDLGSTNGTQLNGRKVARHAPQPLQDNDEVMMGRTLYRFVAPKT
jgi:pSer/pThr/pTyr-binding forkhead associated (FHA) protein